MIWNEAILVFYNFSNFFAICLEFSITLWVGTKRNDNLYSLSFSAISNQFLLKKNHSCIFLIFWIILQFFMNFLLRVGLERNGMIIFIFPVSRSIPTDYGLKWIHNSIFIFSEFFSIFLEFSITRRVETKRNDNFCFPSFSALFNVFWLEMKPQWYFFNFFKFFPIFLEFSITRQVGAEQKNSFYFLPFSTFPPLFWFEMTP